MTNFNTKHLIPNATYRVTMTDPDFGSTEAKTMTGADLKELAYAVGHLYDMTADLIETAETAETADTEQGTQGAEQTTETAPAAEPETETAETIETTETAEPEQTERDARIAEITRAVCHEIVASDYRRKQRVTAKRIREAERAGVPTVRVGYCMGQSLLRDIEPDYYTAGIYGWNFDVYQIAGLTICTGYRGMIGAKAVETAKYEARVIDEYTPFKRAKILAEWIAANLDALQAAREGARA